MKSMLFILLVLLLRSGAGIGQDTIGYNSIFPIASIGYSPSSHLNIYNGHQFSFDIRLKPQLNLATEFAIIDQKNRNPSEFDFRTKIGIQRIDNSYKSSFLTMGINYIYRKTSNYTFEVNTVEENISERRDFQQYLQLHGLEYTVAFHYQITKKIKTEAGFGLGGGVTFEKTDRRVKRTDLITGTSVDLPPTEIPQNISNFLVFDFIGSIHFNIAYTFDG